MPDYSSLLGMMGYEAATLPELFGQYFEDVDPRWTQYLEPSFGLAHEALGELPGLRGGMLRQLTGGLQERGVAAGRELRARRAGAGFAGAGAIERLGRTARRGLRQEYGRGMWDIGQRIAGREAGILGALTGKVGTFLERLLAADVTPAGEGVPPYEHARIPPRERLEELPGFAEEPIGELDVEEVPPGGEVGLTYAQWLDYGFMPGGTPEDYYEWYFKQYGNR